ncbi:hypothetical protein Fleli_2766 [Bernardetia litoralis DSM 6794]|uniref:Uncharacterized protein n=1 Tax=Bernardetia litoralis (strain ATCC 23117 / DSM 6794 / NBRC 15988 / NCIMB 1366 / Fx l1 / Sio-4) TaxID=880071 RepID=I4AMD4_BERLS|nr:hypothetical protein [Bernardetia litoralis]AFM05119.1 hypothetical protein Fleli_2766 [Bernardetia litoralis DSM 6794]
MNILPYESLTYTTHLSKEEVLKKLSNKVEPKRGIFPDNGYQPYEGTISENTFKIKRIIGYRNLFLPYIKGKIEESQDSTLIHIKMRLHPFVIVILCIWSLFMALGGLVFIVFSVQKLRNPSISDIPFFVSPLLIIIVLVLACRAFHSEGNKSKVFFEKLFEVERQENQK